MIIPQERVPVRGQGIGNIGRQIYRYIKNIITCLSLSSHHEFFLSARYVEFKCISRVLTWRAGDKDNLLVVPCSRSDVFTTSAVSLVEKRLLMKFLEFCHEFDRHPEQVEGKPILFELHRLSNKCKDETLRHLWQPY